MNLKLNDNEKELTKQIFVIIITMIIVTFLLMMNLDFYVFGIIIIILIAGVYYYYMRMNKKEGYKIVYDNTRDSGLYDKKYFTRPILTRENRHISVIERPDKDYRLDVGKQHPKTLIPPIIAPRAFDHEVWKDRDDVVRSDINDRRSFFDLENDEVFFDEKKENEIIFKKRVRDKIHPHEISYPAYRDSSENIIEMFAYEEEFERDTRYPRCDPRHHEHYSMKGHCKVDKDLIHNLNQIDFATGMVPSVKPPGGANWHDPHYQGLKLPQKAPQMYSIIDEDLDGIANERIGKDTRLQRDMSLPTNLTISDYERDPRFDDFHRNLHTQTVQPNIFSRHQIIEPINSNLGISFNSQFQPIDTEVGPANSNHYTYTRIDPQLVRDPSDLSPNRAMENPQRNRWTSEHSAWKAEPGSVRIEDIYDPRLTGYGTGYRSYTDINAGQVRYYYSDIDAYRRPNFISRSNVDHMDFQNPMGAILPEYHRKIISENGRELVEDQYLRDTIHHRESMMESLMRKRNSELWQLRAAPVRKDAA